MRIGVHGNRLGFFIFLAGILLSAGDVRPSAAAQIDCDGRMVRDTAFFDSVLAFQLDTASDDQLLLFSFSLWLPDWAVLPDSCYRVVKAGCDAAGKYDPARDSTDYREWLDWTHRWMPRLFDKYPLYGYGDTTLRLPATAASRDNVTKDLLAKKSTILGLSRECSVMRLKFPDPPQPIGIHLHMHTPLSLQGNPRFNALGRKLDPGIGRPETLGIPWRPGPTPAFGR